MNLPKPRIVLVHRSHGGYGNVPLYQCSCPKYKGGFGVTPAKAYSDWKLYHVWIDFKDRK